MDYTNSTNSIDNVDIAAGSGTAGDEVTHVFNNQ